MSQLFISFAGWFQLSYFKKHSLSQRKNILKCETCHHFFHWLLSLAIKQADSAQSTKCIEDQKCGCHTVGNEIDDESFTEEVETSKHFLVDSEVEIGRQSVQFCHEILNAHTSSQKIDSVFEKLKRAAKLNVAFGFLLRNVEDGTCPYYYAHENNTLIERSELEATKEDLVRIKYVLGNTGVIDVCTKEREKRKCKLYKLTNVTVFAALLREVPMRCKDTVLPEPLAKTTLLIVLLTDRRRENRTMSVSVFGFASRRKWGTWEKNFKEVHYLLRKNNKIGSG